MNKPTPAPWEYLWHETWHDRPAYAEVGINLDRGGIDDKLPVAHVWHEPDARLVTAAPLMLEALIEAWNWLNEEIAEPDTLDGYYELVDKIRLALVEAVEIEENSEGIQ